MRGNVVDMAVGIIIGAAFGKIVSSFVNDILMPPLGLAMGGVNFTDLAVVLKEAVGEVELGHLAVADDQGALELLGCRRRRSGGERQKGECDDPSPGEEPADCALPRLRDHPDFPRERGGATCRSENGSCSGMLAPEESSSESARRGFPAVTPITRACELRRRRREDRHLPPGG